MNGKEREEGSVSASNEPIHSSVFLKIQILVQTPMPPISDASFARENPIIHTAPFAM